MTATVQPTLSPAAWHAEEIDELCGLVSLSVSWREIARRVGRTQDEVRAKAQMLGRLS